MLRIGKQGISYRLFDIHIHYRNETDSSSRTETYIYVAHIDYIAHNAQEMHNMNENNIISIGDKVKIVGNAQDTCWEFGYVENIINNEALINYGDRDFPLYGMGIRKPVSHLKKVNQ